MKKIVLFLIIVLSISTFVGCSENSLVQYKEAIEKTEQITKGKTSFNLKVENRFNTNGLSEEEIKKINNYFNKIELNSLTSFNDIKNESYSMMYLNFGGLGYDTDVFIRDNETIIKIPIIDKYVVVKKDDEINIQAENKDANHEIYTKIIYPIKKKWTDILESENVVKGNKSILTTEDGDIKVIKYTVKPSKEQMIELFLFSLNTVSNNQECLQNYETLTTIEESKGLSNLIRKLKKEIEKLESISYEQTVYIDIDGYITKNTIDMELYISDSTPGQIISSKISIEIQNWNNEIEQQIEFPTINPENIIDINKSQGSFMFFLEE